MKRCFLCIMLKLKFYNWICEKSEFGKMVGKNDRGVAKKKVHNF